MRERKTFSLPERARTSAAATSPRAALCQGSMVKLIVKLMAALFRGRELVSVMDDVVRLKEPSRRV